MAKKKSARAASTTARPTKKKAALKVEKETQRKKAPRARRSSSSSAGSELGSRPSWSGNLRLALVTVPVKLFPATRTGARISFHQVHGPSGKRIRYQKMVPGIGPVDSDEIVKGFELDKGRYVLLTSEEVDEVKLEAKKTLDLVQFVEAAEIGSLWFERPYYVVTDGELAEEAYSVLRDALRATKRVGLGQFIMRGREYIAALKPCGNGMVLETLRFADELRKAAPYFAGIDEAKPDPELLALARELIDRKTSPFDPERFKDRYTVALEELIEAKAKNAKARVEVDEEELPAGGRIIDLVEALKRSVGSPGSGPTGTRKKKAS